MPLEPNPMILRQHDARKIGPFQVLDEDGTPHNLSVAPTKFLWRAFDRPGGTALFTVGSNSGSASGGRILISTGKASGHFFLSMTSQAISNATPGHYPTEVEIQSQASQTRTFEGPMLIVQERLL